MANKKKPDGSKNREKIFREKMRGRRTFLGLTQNQLAAGAGISVDLIRAIEGGRSSNPSFFIAIDILKALGISVEEVEQWAGGVNEERT